MLKKKKRKRSQGNKIGAKCRQDQEDLRVVAHVVLVLSFLSLPQSVTPFCQLYFNWLYISLSAD